MVQLQGVLRQEVAAGEAPPRPVVDPAEPVVSVVLIRDLGWVRLRPALVTIGSLLVFLALCTGSTCGIRSSWSGAGSLRPVGPESVTDSVVMDETGSE
ncbi:MAG: hypothetical protein Ct9H300mP12_02750 [Acidimicrobiales bacterium]|nr:MAG: hypothetical protein Ct9H300mP12_02750 [Acidimicrobiales bacterium]